MKEERAAQDQQRELIQSIKFKERPGELPFNASEVVSLADNRFLFCDNNISDCLFEITFQPNGELAGPLVHHRIQGVHPEAIDDLECMALAEANKTKLLFVSSSLCLKKRKEPKESKEGQDRKKARTGKPSAARESIIRMRFENDGNAQAEIIPCFRQWLIENSQVLDKYADLAPDDGGLNIEGLAWDSSEKTLLFGVRTPVIKGRPLVLRVRVKDPMGIWNLSNFEMLPHVTLAVDGADGTMGIRSIKYDESRGVFLVVVGNAVSKVKTPFTLYSWDGNSQGVVKRFPHIAFHPKMKPEGITCGTIGGRGVILFVDDAGGYQYLWEDDPRLEQ